MSLTAGFQNWYEVLEVAHDASHLEIQKAYMRAKDTYSPDSSALYTMFTEQEARDLMKMIEEAYSVLGNVSRREEYDRSLKGLHTSSPQSFKEKAIQPKVSAPSATSSSSDKSDIQVPKGFARTKHSAYEVNLEIEEEIKNQTSFDGDFLKKVRQYKNLTLDHVSMETRISRTYISAIEENKYASLPAAVFVRGFIVQVAKALGLPDQKAANSYMDILKSRAGK